MTATSIFSEKRSKNPLQFLWKWNSNQTNEDKYPKSMNSSLFGKPLENTIHQNNENGLCIPFTVQLCFNEIIKRGLKTEGLFRLSGATSEVIQLQLAFEQQEQQNTMMMDLSKYDIHSITSVVKKYLHFLPDSVIPVNYHDQFLNSPILNLPKEKSIPMLIDLMSLLPKQHRHLLYAILSLSSHIQQNEAINMMNPEALAVVLAPVCTGLEKTLKLSTSSSSKKSMTKKNLKLNLYSLHTCDIQQLIKKNAQWTLFWKWMIENSDAILEKVPIDIDFSLSTASMTNDNTLLHPHPSTPSFIYLHNYYNNHENKNYNPSTSNLYDPYHMIESTSSLLLLSDNNNNNNNNNMNNHHHNNNNRYYASTVFSSSSDVANSSSSTMKHLPPSPPSPRKSIRHRPSRTKLKSKPSNQSILASGISLCNKSSHGFLRRLASVSSLR
ncbi:unnamed protein product [Cunninghamella blakesleeana]